MLGLVAGAAQPQNLGAVDAAATVEAPDGVRLGPALHRLGPLLGHVVEREALQGAHELAVHDPGGERIQVSGHCRHADLVEHGEALSNIAIEDEQPSLGHPPDGAGGGVTRRADLDRSPRPFPGTDEVTGQHPLIVADDREPRVGRRLPLALQQPLRSGQPTAHGRHEGCVEQQVHRDAHRRPSRRDRIPGRHPCGVGAFPRIDRDAEVAGSVSDLAEHRQVGWTEETAGVRFGEQREGLRPAAEGGRLTSATDEARALVLVHRSLRNRRCYHGNSLAHASQVRATEAPKRQQQPRRTPWTVCNSSTRSSP